jgi:hypothetical protein
MKFGTLKSIGHNIADSLASGIGLMIGVYEMDVFAEALAAPEGFIEVDFLTGEASSNVASAELKRAVKLYAAALPDLCKRHGADVSEFRHLSARFSGRKPMFERYTVTVEDKLGRRSIDEYLGIPGKRPKGLRRITGI